MIISANLVLGEKINLMEVRIMSEENALVTGNEQGVVEVGSAFPDLSKLLDGVDGIVTGDIGLKVTRVPIEKYKASTQKIDRIAFITKSVIAVKTHYFENVGSILCFGKKCCEMGGLPSVRYLFPVVVYSTDNEGNLAGKKLDLKILSASEELYKSIITINRATAGTGGIDSVDLLVTCTDDKYQKLTLNQAGPAAWKKSAAAVSFVTEKWTADAEFAYMAIARKVDEESLLNLLGVEGGTASQGSGNAPQRFDEKNTDLTSFFED
jgi:hypothetical protein